jgi:hypothetical protein
MIDRAPADEELPPTADDRSALCPLRNKIRLRATLAVRWRRCGVHVAMTEAARGHGYTYIMLTRPDLQWPCLLPPLWRIAPRMAQHVVVWQDFVWLAPRRIGLAVLAGRTAGGRRCRHKCNMHPGCLQDVVESHNGTVHDLCVWQFMHEYEGEGYTDRSIDFAAARTWPRTSCKGLPRIVRFVPGHQAGAPAAAACPPGTFPELGCVPLRFVDQRADLLASEAPRRDELCARSLGAIRNVLA